LSVRLLEEMSTPALDALDRARTVVVLTVSPLEEHGPHLPVGVDAIAARHFAEALSERLTAARPGWTALLAPTLPLGSFTFEAVGTVSVRQRVVRDAGFRYILVANGHGGPGHLTALEEASAIVSRRHRVTMASLSGHLAWQFLRGRYVEKIAAALGRPLSDDERKAFSEDAHGGWWETSLMLLIRPDLVDPSYRTLPPARYSLPERAVPNFPLRNGGQGYVGHPALADLAFAKAASEVLMAETMQMVEGLLDGHIAPSAGRSPFFVLPFFRTDFWPTVVTATAGIALGVAAGLTLAALGRTRTDSGRSDRRA
jgi:creatinine amidohydrolase